MSLRLYFNLLVFFLCGLLQAQEAPLLKKKIQSKKAPVEEALPKPLDPPSPEPIPDPKVSLPEAKRINAGQKVDLGPNLDITFPKIAAQEGKTFLFEPYTESFINQNIRYLHVILPELKPVLIELGFPKEQELHNLVTLISIAHFVNLFKFHPIFQLRANSLEPVEELETRFVNQILNPLQQDPDALLDHLVNRLRKIPFEDSYALSNLYAAIVQKIAPIHLKSPDSYTWIKTQKENYLQTDEHWTYLSYLNKNPQAIYQNMIASFQELILSNIREGLPQVSRTYLDRSKRLMSHLKLLDPDAGLVKRMELEIEVAGLRFETYENSPQVYEELMALYPQFPGAREYFLKDEHKARVFFPFFDQLMDYANRNFERGRLACEQNIDAELCLTSWKNATQNYRYVAKHAPFRILSLEALRQLKRIQESNKTEYRFLEKSDYLDLVDRSLKPWL